MINSLHQSTKEIGKLLIPSEYLSLQVQSQLVSELTEKNKKFWHCKRFAELNYILIYKLFLLLLKARKIIES